MAKNVAEQVIMWLIVGVFSLYVVYFMLNSIFKFNLGVVSLGNVVAILIGLIVILGLIIWLGGLKAIYSGQATGAVWWYGLVTVIILVALMWLAPKLFPSGLSDNMALLKQTMQSILIK